MNQSEYKIYPLLLLGFFRVANIVIINLAIPIFFFQLGYAPGLIGIISASMNFVYIFSPVIFKNIPEKIGNKNSLIICILVITGAQLFYQFTANPYTFLGLRLIEGLMLGLFWPVLNSSLSILTSVEKNELGGENESEDLMENKLIRKYSLSWNLGSVFSFLLGSFLLFFIADINLMFDISFLYILICLILTFLFQEPKKMNKKNKELPSIEQPNIEVSKFKNVNYPVFLPFFIISMYGFLEHANGLIYPIKYEILGFPLFINYLSSFILIAFQTTFTFKGMSLSLKTLKRLAIGSITILSIVLIIAGLNSNVYLFLILFGAFGTSLAFLYCFSFKMIILRNIIEDTSKYGFYFESFISLSFFLGTFLGGFIADVGINFTYFTLSFVAIIGLLFYFTIQNKIKFKKIE